MSTSRPDPELLAIGRFASMCRVSVKALRHYYDIGLLEPARGLGTTPGNRGAAARAGG